MASRRLTSFSLAVAWTLLDVAAKVMEATLSGEMFSVDLEFIVLLVKIMAWAWDDGHGRPKGSDVCSNVAGTARHRYDGSPLSRILVHA